MLYLGEQNNALNQYSEKAICFLNIRIHGRKKRNGNGYSCGNNNCEVCKNLTKASKKLKLHKRFLDLLTPERIRLLVTSKPDKLLDILEETKIDYGKPFKLKHLKFKEQCKKLFVLSGYNNWFQNGINNYSLAKDLGIHSCTYCNREYTMAYKPDGHKGKGMVPQFDHWFPKKEYPLLALSFYNLIPSCATCNGIKSSVEMNLDDHMHPYVDCDISSSYCFDYLLNSTHQPRIAFLNKRLDKKSINTIYALNLPMIYSGHSDKELKDLYDLRYKYSNNYLQELLDNTFKSLPISEQEKYRLIFGIELDSKNYHKRIMSKFKSDIVKKLLSIKN